MLFRGKYTVLGILYTRVKFLREELVEMEKRFLLDLQHPHLTLACHKLYIGDSEQTRKTMDKNN